MKKTVLVAMIMILALCVAVSSGGEASENNTWQMGQYVDDFGDPTGNSFLYTEAEGTFSNTAASDAALLVKIRYNKSSDSIELELMEYKEKSAVFYTNSDITLKFKVDGQIYSHSLSSSNAPGNIIGVNDKSQNWADVNSSMSAREQLNTIQKTRTFEKSAFQQISKFLMDGKDIRFVLQIDSSKYSFTIPANGFSEALYEDEYNAAVDLLTSGEYEQAYEKFSAIGDYKDSKEKMLECQQKLYGNAVSAIEELQKAKGISLREALAIVEADPAYDESDLHNAFMESLRVYAKCEGVYTYTYSDRISRTERKYDLSISYMLEQGKVTASVTYENAPPGFEDVSVELLSDNSAGYLVEIYATRIDYDDQRWNFKVKEDEAVAKLNSYWTDVCQRQKND